MCRVRVCSYTLTFGSFLWLRPDIVLKNLDLHTSYMHTHILLASATLVNVLCIDQIKTAELDINVHLYQLLNKQIYRTMQSK